ncbi:MAG: CAP domain-containing protein [Patescibacteria group bacterium]
MFIKDRVEKKSIKRYRRGDEWRWLWKLAPSFRHRGKGEEQKVLRDRNYYPWWQRIVHWFIPHERNGYRPHAVHHHALIGYSMVLITAKVGLTLTLFLSVPNEAYFSTLTAQRVVDLTNQARTEVGISSLTVNPLLERSAEMKAEDMATFGYFAHTNLQGESPWEDFKRAGYEYTYAGENLAMDFREAEEVVRAWMESPKHRENILNPKYQEIGIVVTTGKVRGRIVNLIVQHFGTSYLAASKRSFAPSALGASTQGTGEKPTLAAAATHVTLAKSTKPVSLSKLIDVGLWTFAVFAFGMILQLVLTMVIHIKIQHRGTIYACLAVIALAVGLLYTNVHFLEQFGEVPIIF